MSDDTEEGTKPSPKKRAKARKRAPTKQETIRGQVIDMFGHGDTPPMDPDGIRPVYRGQRGQSGPLPYEGKNGPRKTPPRKRIRLSARWTEVENNVKAGVYTWAEFVETLTPEEIVRGQLKTKDGNFASRPTKLIPQQFHDACIREMLKLGERIWRGAYLEAIKVYTEIAQDKELEPKDRLRAAQYIIERIAGKVPDKLEVASAAPWETIIDGIVAEAEDANIARASHILSGEGADTVVEDTD